MPDFAFERRLSGLVCGIDEAGRGPLAGPVLAAAVILLPEGRPPGRGPGVRRLPKLLRQGLDDSKRVPPEKREELYVALTRAAREGLVRFAAAAASVAEIDRLNILAATHLAMSRAVAALGVVPDVALVDGDRAPVLPCPVETVVGGDGLSLSIAAASIVAKVTRDRLMARLAARYPGYRWEQNMGYGTPEHLQALFLLGATCHHRQSFAPVRFIQGELSL